MRAVRRAELLRDLDRSSGWTLMVEGTEQSYVDVDDPTHLEFEYMQHVAIVIDSVSPRPAPVDAVHLGGGACTLPRWIAATRPGSAQTVVEVSEEILRASAPLGPVPGTTLVVADAVEQLHDVASGGADLVMWDLYDGPRVVTSTLTLDVVGSMRRALRSPGGLVLLNVSDARPFDVVRPVVAALRVCFDDVALLAQPSTLRGRRSGNCVLVGALSALPLAAIVRAARAASAPARVLHGEELERFTDGAVPPTADAPLPAPDEALGRGFL
jgi:spermidine synthase